MQVDKMVEINSNVILDDLWLWRADHSVAGEAKNLENPV